jgi:hypothetical protein
MADAALLQNQNQFIARVQENHAADGANIIPEVGADDAVFGDRTDMRTYWNKLMRDAKRQGTQPGVGLLAVAPFA